MVQSVNDGGQRAEEINEADKSKQRHELTSFPLFDEPIIKQEECKPPILISSIPTKSADLARSDLCRAKSWVAEYVIIEMKDRIQEVTTTPKNPVEQWRQQQAADTVSTAVIDSKLCLVKCW